MWSPKEWNSSEEIRPIEDAVAIDKNGRTLYLRDLCTLVSWGMFHFLLDCCMFYLHLPLKFLVKTKQNKTKLRAQNLLAWSESGDYPQLSFLLLLLIQFLFYFYFLFIFTIYIVVDFVIHWNETAMGLHVFPIPIPPPTSLSTRSPRSFQCTRSGRLSHASNLGWWSVSP